MSELKAWQKWYNETHRGETLVRYAKVLNARLDEFCPTCGARIGSIGCGYTAQGGCTTGSNPTQRERTYERREAPQELDGLLSFD